MKAFVLSDTSLRRHAGRFVWLDIDRENATNSEFRRRFPVTGVPTFMLIDPATATVSVSWLGGFTLPQLHAFLDDAESHGGAPQALITALARADSLYGVPDYAAAVPAYDHVLADAPAGWHGAIRVVEAQLFALGQTHQDGRVVDLARAWLPRLGRSVSALNVASSALSSALALPDSAAGRAGAIAEMDAATRTLVEDTTYVAAADDRSGAWIALLDARQQLDDSLGARAVARRWSDFLDGQAARARTPEQRAVFDPHRLSAYLELGEPERAVTMLQQSERDMPGDYNPPARLAAAYRAMKRWDDALAACDRAMALAYGPRKLNFYDLRAEIEKGRGDLPAARSTLTAGIAYAEALPEEQRSPARIAAFRKKLDALGR